MKKEDRDKIEAEIESLEKSLKQSEAALLRDEAIKRRVVENCMVLCVTESDNETIVNVSQKLYEDSIAKHFTENKVPVYQAIVALETILVSLCKQVDRQEREAAKGGVVTDLVSMACSDKIN